MRALLERDAQTDPLPVATRGRDEADATLLERDPLPPLRRHGSGKEAEHPADDTGAEAQEDRGVRLVGAAELAPAVVRRHGEAPGRTDRTAYEEADSSADQRLAPRPAADVESSDLVEGETRWLRPIRQAHLQCVRREGHDRTGAGALARMREPDARSRQERLAGGQLWEQEQASQHGYY